MKILFFPKEFPHSKVVGGPILIYHRMRILAQRGHKVHLLTFMKPEDKQYLDSLNFLDKLVSVPYPKKRGRVKKIFDFFFAKTPNYLLNTYSKEAQEAFDTLVRQEKYEAVITEYAVMAQYIYKSHAIPEDTLKVASVHEVYTTARLKYFLKNPLKPAGWNSFLHYLQLKGYEFKMYRAADLILVLTEGDKNDILKYDPSLAPRIEIVPHGVDVKVFNPKLRKPEKGAIVFLGNYGHEPNWDAVLWFYHEIFPQVKKEIPYAKFYMVGRAPTPAMRKIAQQDKSVVVTGFVEDVRDYLKLAEVFVVPVRLGGGFRGKTLEGMAMGLPVVSTSLGAWGIKGHDGVHFLVADDAASFAEKVIQLLKDKSLADKIAKNARKLIEENYSWEAGAKRLEGILETYIKRKRLGGLS